MLLGVTAAGVDAICSGEMAEIWQFIGYVLYVFKIAIPLLLIIFGMIDLGKAVIASDDKEIKNALSLDVNEDSIKEVKNARARLNKIKTTMEDKRKQVKNAVLNPYNEFEAIYNELVKDKLSKADEELKSKIDTVENTLKQEKENELREFAIQHIKANNLEDIITFDDIGLNITLSASIKSLKEQTLNFIQNIANDVKLIELEEYKDEILIEYINNIKWSKKVDFAQSKLNIIERHKQLEEMKNKQKEIQLMIDEEDKIVEKVEEVLPPKEIITVTFTINDTKENIIKVREFMKKEGIKYE